MPGTYRSDAPSIFGEPRRKAPSPNGGAYFGEKGHRDLRTDKTMKMRKSMIELLERLENERGGERTDAPETAEHRLGAAMLERLGIPEGIDREEAVDRILLHWDELSDSYGAEAHGNGMRMPEREQPVFKAEYTPQRNEGRVMLPRPIPGRLGQAPEADYESMSAEQFRRLRKQLKRAASDGRRVRL